MSWSDLETVRTCTPCRSKLVKKTFFLATFSIFPFLVTAHLELKHLLFEKRATTLNG